VKPHREHAVVCTEISSERLSGGNSMLKTIFRLLDLHFGQIKWMPNRPQAIDNNAVALYNVLNGLTRSFEYSAQEKTWRWSF
jgi:hypothetical protein